MRKHSPTLKHTQMIYLIVIGLLFTLRATAEVVCYAVADNDRTPNSKDVLVKLYPNGITDIIGVTGSAHIEAIAFDLEGQILYAADSGQLGQIDLSTGNFMPIGSGFGRAQGAEGPIILDDIDGLTFDEATGKLYATHRREHQNPQQYDILFEVNPQTGQYVANAFGGQQDYVVITGADYDIDDIASDPKDGQLYVISNAGDGVKSVLAVLERGEQGVPTGHAQVIGPNYDDIESLSFDKEPDVEGNFRLFGTTGNGGAQKEQHPEQRNQLYEIKIQGPGAGAAAALGKLIPPSGEPQRDFEAVSCKKEVIISDPNCVMYAVHDEGLNDSQIIEIKPFSNDGAGVIRPLGPLYLARDIEGLAILPSTGELFGTSGSDGLAEVPDGYLYKIDRQSGALTPIGPTGFSEVSAFTVNPADNTLWAWSKGGGDRQQTSPVGPITIDPVSGKGTLMVAEDKFQFNDPMIEALAWDPKGQKLYASDEYNLWVYEHGELNLACEQMNQQVKGRVEAMEMQPNGLLLLGTDTRKDRGRIGLIAYDPQSCEVVAHRFFTQTRPYHDIESIEWPANDCDNRSWLHVGSFDATIELEQLAYDWVPDAVEEALRLALEKAGITAQLEAGDGEIVVYIGDLSFTAKPLLTQNTRNKAASSAGQVIDAHLVDDAQALVFQLLDNQGQTTTETWQLTPTIASNDTPEEVSTALNTALKAVGIQGQVQVDAEQGEVCLHEQHNSLCGQFDLAAHKSKPAQLVPQAADASAQITVTFTDVDQDGDADVQITSADKTTTQAIIME